MAVTKELDGREETILDSINEGVFTVDLNWRITAFKRKSWEEAQDAARRTTLCHDARSYRLLDVCYGWK